MNKENQKEIADQVRNDANPMRQLDSKELDEQAKRRNNATHLMYGVDVFYDSAQGEYYRTYDKYFEKKLVKVPLAVCDKVIIPGDLTDLSGFFNRELKYCGENDNGEAIFLMFDIEGAFYYEPLAIIAPLRIYKQFHPQHGRDFNFKNNKWV